MAKVDGSYKSLIQGVSQQPDIKRLDGQCSQMVNMSADPVRNLTRRISSNFVGSLGPRTATQILTLEGEDRLPEFVGLKRPGALHVYDLDSTEMTVTVTGSAATDLLSGGPLVSTSIDGITYLADTQKEVVMGTDTLAFEERFGIVYVQGGVFSRDYSVTVDGTTVSHTTPDGTSSAHSAQISTEAIAEELTTLLNGIAGITALRQSDVIQVSKVSGELALTTDDGDGGVNLKSVTKTIARAETLPRYAPHGFHVAIVGDGQSADDDWYVMFEIPGQTLGNNSGFGLSGVWRETTAIGALTNLDAATMPHTLIQTGPTSFDLAQGDWEPRKTGNDTTNPQPSLVGTTVRDLGSFQSRLAILTTDTLLMSKTNRLTDLWRASSTTSLATDPIDILSTSTSTILRHLVPHNRDLLVFADQAQFIVFGRTVLTPDNASLVLTTSIQASPVAKPRPAGRNIFFAVDAGKVSRVKEYFAAGDADINDSRDITSHVSEYIAGQVIDFASSDNLNVLITRTDDNAKVMYSYEYIWSEGQKLQAAWSKWEFSREVVHAFFKNERLYLIKATDNEYWLEYIDFGELREAAGIPVFLDSKTEVSGINTTIVLPYPAYDEDETIVVQGAGCPNPGLTVPVDFTTGNTVELREDMGGGTVITGGRFMSLYEPTDPVVKDQNGAAITIGSLILNEMIFSYRDTGYLKVSVESPYRDTYDLVFEGREFGSPTTLLGEPAVQSGTMAVPVCDEMDHVDIIVSSDSHMPLTVLDIEWAGQFNKFGQRI